MTIASSLDSTAQQLARIEDVFLVDVLVQGEYAQARRVGNLGQQSLFVDSGEEVHATGIQFKSNCLRLFRSKTVF